MIIIDILKDACRQVYEQTKNLIGTVEGSQKFGKGAGGDISRKVDLVAEKTVIDTIKRNKFKPTIIGEECGTIKGEKGFLIMDAIDGTTNASRGIPFCCCSLAYAIDYKLSSVVDAAIIDLARGDLYYASKGTGAYLNGNKIEVRKYSDKRSAGEQQEKDILIGMNISGVSEDIINRLSIRGNELTINRPTDINKFERIPFHEHADENFINRSTEVDDFLNRLSPQLLGK